MKELVELLKKKHLSIASIESFTAGLFASKLGDVSGVSTVFKGSLVAYSTQIKTSILKIDQTIIDNYGVISAECVQSMAEKGRELFESDITVAFSGNAGPESMEYKPAGLWFCAIAYPAKTEVFSYQSDLERNNLRNEAVNIATRRIIHELLGLA